MRQKLPPGLQVDTFWSIEWRLSHVGSNPSRGNWRMRRQPQTSFPGERGTPASSWLGLPRQRGGVLCSSVCGKPLAVRTREGPVSLGVRWTARALRCDSVGKRAHLRSTGTGERANGPRLCGFACVDAPSHRIVPCCFWLQAPRTRCRMFSPCVQEPWTLQQHEIVHC